MTIFSSNFSVYHFEKKCCEKSGCYILTLNFKYIERIYKMLSWQFFNGFYTILSKSQYLQKYINSHEYAGTVL